MNNTDLDYFEIPPFLKKPPEDSREWAEKVVSGIDARVAWLAERSLRPHLTVIERLAENVLNLDGCKVPI
jgi:hypothetical protein